MSYQGGFVVYEAIRIDDKDAVFHAAHNQFFPGRGTIYRTSCGIDCMSPRDWRDQCGVQPSQRCTSCRWTELPLEPQE